MTRTPSDHEDPAVDDAAFPQGGRDGARSVLGPEEAGASRAPAAGGAARKPGRGRRRTLRAVLLSVMVVVLVLVLAVVGVGLWLRHSLGSGIETFADPFSGISTRAPQQKVEDGEQPATNILVMGSDSRISSGDPSQWEAGAQRTDALMIMQIGGDRDSVSVISIPRDTWVEIPGHGQGKINSAYARGGPALTIQTVESLTGVRIHHVAIADFESFTSLTDQIGGVTIELQEPQTLDGTDFPAGPQRLNGRQALDYTRERESLPGGDFDRVKRQQAWMRAIITQVLSNGTLSSPTRLYSFLSSATRTVAVDEGFSLNEMQSLAWEMREVRGEDISFMTAPVSGTSTSPDGQSIVLLDEGASQEVFSAFADDSVDEYLEANPDAVELLPATVS